MTNKKVKLYWTGLIVGLVLIVLFVEKAVPSQSQSVPSNLLPGVLVFAPNLIGEMYPTKGEFIISLVLIVGSLLASICGVLLLSNFVKNILRK